MSPRAPGEDGAARRLAHPGLGLGDNRLGAAGPGADALSRCCPPGALPVRVARATAMGYTIPVQAPISLREVQVSEAAVAQNQQVRSRSSAQPEIPGRQEEQDE